MKKENLALYGVGAALVLAAAYRYRQQLTEQDKILVGEVTQLYIYPVKSLKGIKIETGFIEERGFAFDRRWMLIDQNNVFLSQRRFRKLALIQPSIVNGHSLKLEADGFGEIEVPIIVRGTPDGEHKIREVEIWEKKVQGAVDQGDRIAMWLENVLGKKGIRMVYMTDATVRPTNPKRADSFVSFADGYPYLLASEESLAELNQRMEHKEDNVGIDRFRPNIVLKGSKAFAEDTFNQIQFGHSKEVLNFRNVKSCERCIMTTINQKTAKLGGLKAEPLKTLKTFRAVGEEVMFGVNLVMLPHKASCAPVLTVGDPVFASINPARAI
mmetsp:Transcript_18165/g.23745  ORF Transcript_18165/g.23745 Transcript_18165/m.23745 type:complete len:326 (-) Transcript_18165:104-1081(-)